MCRSIPIYSIALPEYTAAQEPDYAAIGSKLDTLIVTHFLGRAVVIRGIGLADHPGKSLGELAAIIQQTGTDRYDAARAGLYYPKDTPADIHAAPPSHYGESDVISPSLCLMDKIIRDFYEGAQIDRGHSIRLDLLMIYDQEALSVAAIPGESEENVCMYVFQNPDAKADALLGIIEVLR